MRSDKLVRFYFVHPADSSHAVLHTQPVRFCGQYERGWPYRKPVKQFEDKRMPALAPIKRNPLLTKEYLEGGSGLEGCEKQINRLWGQILSPKFEVQGILGGVKYCPPETVSRQKKKMGRPTKYHRPMSGKERQRKKRGQEVFQMRKYTHPIGILNLGEDRDWSEYRPPSEPWRTFALPAPRL
jgi:hypothetical protein